MSSPQSRATVSSRAGCARTARFFSTVSFQHFRWPPKLSSVMTGDYFGTGFGTELAGTGCQREGPEGMAERNPNKSIPRNINGDGLRRQCCRTTLALSPAVSRQGWLPQRSM